jgi:hypothetical protein
VWKSAIALTVTAAVGAGCKGTHAEATEQAATGSDLTHVEQALAQIVATCAQANGTAEIRRKGQARWEKLEVGATFRERDWVRTGANSTVRVRFAHGGFLDLGENTTMLVDTAVSVESGTVVGIADTTQPFVVNAADGSQAKISAAGGDRVEFRLTPSATKGVEIAVTKGKVDVVTTEGTRTVGAGEATDLAGQHTSEIVKLLAFPKSLAPGVDARFLFAPKMKIPLAWSAVPAAAKYHVQVARDTDFYNLVSSADSTAPNNSFTPDAEGMYAWRVAARDASGRLGEWGFARRIYCENGEPTEMLIAPPDGITVEFPNKPPQVQFSWRPMGDVKKYRLVVSRADGDEGVVSTVTTAQQASVALDEGKYSWGIYAIRASGEEPIFLSLRQLTVKKMAGPKIHTEVQWKKN